MRVLVIEEDDLRHNEKDIIGVASSPEKAEEMISKYYGTFDVIAIFNVSDVDEIHSDRLIKVSGGIDDGDGYGITFRWFKVDYTP